MAFVACVLVSSTALASPRVAADNDEKPAAKDDEQLVLLNASSKLGDRGQIDRIRRVLDSKGMLLRLPERLEAALDGRSVLIADVDAIREAYTKMDFARALEIVQADETRILDGAGVGDPIPALADLSEWRGLIAAGMERPDEATKWFRTAIRLNPAWSPDKKLTSARVRPLIKKARKETEESGKLRIDVDPETAMVQIDDRKPQSVKDKLTLEAGHHLVLITADGRTPYAELVEITPDKTYKLEISLEKESKADRAAKAIDATVAAQPGKPRLKKAKALSLVAGGAQRFLVIEEGTDDKLTLRLYDVGSKKVSRPLDLANETSANAIARKVIAALEPDNMIEPSSVMIIEKQRSQRWYERWYVWVGVAAVAGGGFLGYQHLTREPTSIRGF
ncbi:MAG: PEGA domain-containing protein [Deltaproteobacteria bacterium]|nr:PEGA domain-containing protein [Deltaproteobacteria bacterium]